MEAARALPSTRSVCSCLGAAGSLDLLALVFQLFDPQLTPADVISNLGGRPRAPPIPYHLRGVWAAAPPPPLAMYLCTLI